MYVVGSALVDSGDIARSAPDDAQPCTKKKPKPGPTKFHGRIAVVVSSDNLLLNGWRASQFGNGVTLCVDATHRLVTEGHGVLVFCVADIAQATHVLAYGIFTQEDQFALEHCLTQLNSGVDAVAARYARNGWAC